MPRLKYLFVCLILLASCAKGREEITAAPQAPSDADRVDAGLVVTNPSEGRPFFHDYGELQHGTKAEHVFVLRNTDPDPVLIVRQQAACTCTRVRSMATRDASGEMIEGNLDSKDGIVTVLPGEELFMTVQVDTNKVRPNIDRLAILRVTTDSKATPFLTFEMHVLSLKAFRVTPDSLNLGDLPQSAGGAGEATILTGFPGLPVRVQEVASSGEHLETLLDETQTEGQTFWRLHAIVPPGLPYGTFRDTVLLATTDIDGVNEGAPIAIEVTANIVDDVMLYPRQFVFGAVASGEEAGLEGTLKALVPGARIAIDSATIEGEGSEHLAARWEALTPDATGRSYQWRVFLTTRATVVPGSFEGRLVLHLDDDQQPTAAVNYILQVR